MFDKLRDAQKRMDEIKKRLETVMVSEQVQNGDVKVTATASRKIAEIKIKPDFINNASAEEVEELITIAVNRALETAEKVAETEMQAAARDILPGFPGMFGK